MRARLPGDRRPQRRPARGSGLARPRDLGRTAGQPRRRLPAARLNRPNLTVLAGCLVTRLRIRGGRCAGAEYLRDGVPQQAHASAEVIVCAGAIGSPQLLMLSGIGPAEHLRGVGIDPVADLPGTGANLQDHPIAMACYASAVPLPRAGTTTGKPTPPYPARWQATGLTCTCSRSCCPSPRLAFRPRPEASPWWPPLSPRTAGGRSGWPPPAPGRAADRSRPPA